MFIYMLIYIVSLLIPISRMVNNRNQMSNDSNIKPATVKEGLSILYPSETSLQWTAIHLTFVHGFLCIWVQITLSLTTAPSY